jgi:hypothetical protein
MLRRVGALGVGLAMTASVGLAGVGVASAASPALKVKPGALWTFKISENGGCEVDTFHANFTFKGDSEGDKGTWGSGGSSLQMTWTAGSRAGDYFNGLYFADMKEYSGSIFIGASAFPATVVKGAMPGC